MGKRIRKLRGNISQDKCAEALGISRGALSFYENGERKPDAEIIFKMSAYFNVSADYLLGISNNKTIDMNLKAVCKYTGLSENAIEHILTLNDTKLSYFNTQDYLTYSDEIYSSHKIEFLNFLLENQSISYLLCYAFDYALDKLEIEKIEKEGGHGNLLLIKKEFADFKFMKIIKQYFGDQALIFTERKNILTEAEKDDAFLEKFLYAICQRESNEMCLCTKDGEIYYGKHTET